MKKARCLTPYCKNKKVEGANYCSTCRKKKWRKAHPMKAAYQTLVYNARRRKIFCDLTYAQFQQFCIATDYMAGKGRTALSYSIDREKEELGYTAGNIKRLTVSENSMKEQARRKKMLVYDYQTGYAKVI